MSRSLLLVFLFVCLIYISQANPLPQDAEQSVSSNFDDLTSKAKQIFDDAKGALEKSELNDALEKAKSFIGQAGENIRKEIEKIAEKLRD